jgi:hypothetical protein
MRERFCKPCRDCTKQTLSPGKRHLTCRDLFYWTACRCLHCRPDEDGRDLPDLSGPHAEEVGEVLEGMYADRRKSIEEAKIQRISGRAGGQVSVLETRSGPAGIVSRAAGSCRCDYCTSANTEGLQGVKAPSGPVDMNATRKRRLRCRQPPLGGPIT